jgi:DNA-directed RNA polymerase subunit RPC12/RpoP
MAENDTGNWTCTNCAKAFSGKARTTLFMSNEVKCPHCGAEFEAPASVAVRIALAAMLLFALGTIAFNYFQAQDLLLRNNKPALSLAAYAADIGWFSYGLLALLVFANYKDFNVRLKTAAAEKRRQAGVR